VVVLSHCQASGGDTRAGDYGGEVGDGGGGKRDSDLHADHGREYVGDCDGKGDGGDGGEGAKTPIYLFIIQAPRHDTLAGLLRYRGDLLS